MGNELSKSWLAKIFTDSIDPIIIEDLTGYVIDLNREAEYSYGFSREELTGKPIKSIVPKERHAQADDLLNRCLHGESVRNVEGLRCTKEGEILPVLLTLSALKDDKGKNIAIASIAKDITVLKEKEIQLKHMSKVFMDSCDPIIIEDLTGCVIDLNQEAEYSYGFSREELIGKPIKTVVPKEKHGQADDLLKRCLQGEEVRNIEGLRYKKDGRIIPVLLTLSALKDDKGKNIAIASIAKDITALKEKEIHLKQMSKVFMDSSDPIIIEDLNGYIIDLNREAELTYGFSRKELIGKPVKTLVPKERHAQAEELLRIGLTEKKVKNIEGLRWTKDHEIHPVLLTLSTLKDDTGKISAVATIAKDITKLKSIEKELQDEKANLEKSVENRTYELQKAKTKLQELAKNLSKYLSPQIYKSIFEGNVPIKIQSKRKWLSIFFSDIVNFTETTEMLDPEQITELLNEYLLEMTNIVFKYGGTLDKFIGDAVLVFFGDPETKGREEDAYRTISMAIEMQNCLNLLRSKWVEEGIQHPFHIRIGITSGFCTVGNFGYEKQMSYTVIGRQVNLAARLQSQASQDKILVDKPTASLLKAKIHLKGCDPISVKGFTNPVEVYEVVEKPELSQVVNIEEKDSGFSLSLDLSRLTQEKSDSLCDKLRHVIKKIERKEPTE